VKFLINKTDIQKINRLFETKETNIALAGMLQYFFQSPKAMKAIKSEDIYLQRMMKECDVDMSIKENREIAARQIKPFLKRIDEKIIAEDPYHRCLNIPDTKSGEYALKKQISKAYQAFSYDEIDVLEDDFSELQKVGYFEKSVQYLALTHNHRVWMSITPNEINTHAIPIKNAHGHVVTFGLGMGYFVFNVIQKEEVKSITVIENDPQIIDFFKQLIMPQLKEKAKINIVCADAYSYIKETHKFDYAYVDLWHNPNDGLPFYLAFKKAESNFPNCAFNYWLETSILSLYRRCLLTVAEEQLNNVPESSYQKAKNDMDEVINEIYFKTKGLVIKSYQQFHDLLLDNSLKSLIIQ